MIDSSAVVALILAAGQSRRFGKADKLMADYRGKPLVTHAADLAASLSFCAVLAVCRADGEVGPLLQARGVAVHINSSPEAGMGSSLAIGIDAAARFDAEACLILLGDMPDVTGAHLISLLAAFDAEHDIVGSSSNGRRLPPTLFGRRHFSQLRTVAGDEGARRMTRQSRAVEAPAWTLKDIDEPVDLSDGLSLLVDPSCLS